MEVLLDGIPLDEVSTSMTINAPAAVLLLLAQSSSGPTRLMEA
jgi:methylmalonyl-CoA mutase N-terminal domain/subunit